MIILKSHASDFDFGLYTEIKSAAIIKKIAMLISIIIMFLSDSYFAKIRFFSE